MRYPQLMLIPPALAGVGLLLPHLAAAYTTPHVRTVSKNSDYFYNYDFNDNEDDTISQRDVDMPMTMLWDCSAEIDAVKDNVFDPNGWHRVSGLGDNGRKYGYLYENSNSEHPEWDGDKGVQTDGCEDAGGGDRRQMHTRLYAPTDSPYYDQMYNSTWSYYFVASTHYDYNHADCDNSNEERFGWPELVEGRIVNFADPEHAVFQDESVNFYNQEDGFELWQGGKRHHYDSNGYAARMCYK